MARPRPAGAPLWAMAPNRPRRAGGNVSPSIACPAPQVPPIPRPARARARTRTSGLGARPQSAFPTEKAAIETAIDIRRPSRSLIQPNSSPPTPVIPTPTAVRRASSASERPNAS